MAKQPQGPADFDLTRMMAEFKLPAMPAMPDMEAFLGYQRRNMETLSQANRVALEGAQAVAKRHMEIAQQAMAELTDAMKSISAAEAPQAKAAKQAELLKTSYAKAVSNMKEIADLIQRANGEALSLINRRFAEAMDEVKTMAEKSGR